MTEIINFKNSPYFLFKQHLEASWGGIGIHTKESFDLNGPSSWFDDDRSGYALFQTESQGETYCNLFLKYSSEGNLIEFRILNNGENRTTDHFKLEKDLINEHELSWGNKDKQYGVSSIFYATLETNIGELVFECQHGEGITKTDVEEGSFNPNEYLNIRCESGIYDIYEVHLKDPKTIIPMEEVHCHYPCCHKKLEYDLKSRPKNLSLYCKDCNKYHTRFEDYLTHNGQRINFNTNKIQGYQNYNSDSLYGWCAHLRKGDKLKPEFKFMFEH